MASFRRKGIHLYLKQRSILQLSFLLGTEGLIFIGKVDITASALSLLMKHQIDTVFLSTNGKFNGKLTFSEKKNVFLRLKQYKLLNDYNARLSFSKEITAVKLKNQVTFLHRIKRKNKFDEQSIYKAIDNIKNLFPYIDQAKDVETLRGYEGFGAKNYFSVFGKDIIQDWAVFNGRSRNPPRDNVNAVLSFLYTLLYQRVDSAIESEDLDPYIGMFHEIDYGKRTLSFDLMEEFRVPIVDTLTISLFNLGILDKEDFRTVEFSTDSDENPLEDEGKVATGFEEEKSENCCDEKLVKSSKGVLLNEDGLRKCIEGFEKKMASTILSPSSGRTVSYWKLIREQVGVYKRFINQEESTYKPFIYR